VTREELELLTEILDFTTLFFVILRRESSGRFVKTELIKLDLCTIIVRSCKTSATTKQQRLLLHEVDEWLESSVSRR